jgi:glycosyltransferase involved in cell wall biosynthesis
MYTKINPKWSVIIPTFNCAKYLEQTLLSILQQDPGEDLMQIEVVDDCSTNDDPEEVVNRIGKGRIQFYRQNSNVGAINNFNTCIKRARGEFVHILHGDDLIAIGFYEEINNLISRFPNIALYATRTFLINEANIITSVSPYLINLSFPSLDNQDLFYNTPLQFSGVVVSNTYYKNTNGFLSQLKHTADVEMWARLIFTGKGVVSEKILSYYRIFEGNDTSVLRKKAENLNDYFRLASIFEYNYSNFDLKKFKNNIFIKTVNQVNYFLEIKDFNAAKNSIYFYIKHQNLLRVFLFLFIKERFFFRLLFKR